MRYHCTVCDDFDLCKQCYEKVGHPHKMEKHGLDLDVGSTLGNMTQTDLQEVRKLSIQRCIQSLVFACQCRDANCRLPSCMKMKRVVTHTKMCRREMKSDCPICKQLIVLCCYHAKRCQETKCSVIFCSSIKRELKQRQLHAPPAPLQQQTQSQILEKALMNVMAMLHTPPCKKNKQRILRILKFYPPLMAVFFKPRQVRSVSWCHHCSQDAAAGRAHQVRDVNVGGGWF